MLLATTIRISTTVATTTSTGDQTGLVIFLLVVGFMGAVVLYAYLYKRKSYHDQKKMARAFRQNPVLVKGAPALLHGLAIAPDIILPTTGEHVAWYAMFVLAREMNITGTSSRAGIGGIAIGTGRITSVHGFRFVRMSGDFAVRSGGTAYTVRISSPMDWFAKGSAKVSSVVKGTITSSGFPAPVYDDSIGFTVAEAALDWVFRFALPMKTRQRGGGRFRWNASTYTTVKSIRSTIDSRVHEYVSGFNLPEGIAEILKQKGITPEEKAEITVAEIFIPLNREVYVFGTFDGDNGIVHADPRVRFSVSYEDPESI